MCASAQVASISRETLFGLAGTYPQALQTLSKAARHLTIRQALILYYRKFVRLNRRLPGRGDMHDIASAAYDKTNAGGLRKEVHEQVGRPALTPT